ncbi:MAG: lipid-binding SYLF domain-containing protein [Halieaceae bacterium]|jgi:lipid-binding SYLF domain-containing protein
MKQLIAATLCIFAALSFSGAHAWDPKDEGKPENEAAAAKQTMLASDPAMQRFFDAAAGWVIIPTVGKAGFGIGGARGKGLLFEGGSVAAEVTLTQLTVGFQWGGQAYSEFIFFETPAAVASFKEGNFELGAQVSAVAITAGASADVNYRNGLAVFTQTKGGLMYEASVGGQKFKVKLKK